MVKSHSHIAPQKPRPVAFQPNTFRKGGLLERADVPSSAFQWRCEFAGWVSERFAESRRNDAPFFPEAGSREEGIQHLNDLLLLGFSVELNAPLVAAFFLEYLSEHPARVDWWRRFQLLGGPCAAFDGKRGALA